MSIAAHADGWRSIGRTAARNGNKLSVVLTNNPEIDAMIREGYEAEFKARQTKTVKEKDAPFSVDLFGHRIK